jgi:hypothetical protein
MKLVLKEPSKNVLVNLIFVFHFHKFQIGFSSFSQKELTVQKTGTQLEI